MEQLSLFAMPFMVKATVSLVFASATLSLLGLVVVVLNLSALRFTLMHMGLLGSALGMVFNVDPLVSGMASITAGSLLFGPISERSRIDVGMVTALFMTGSLAASFLLLFKAGVPAMDAFSIFTGSILMLSKADVAVTFALGMTIMVGMNLFYWEINAVLYNRDLAGALGIKTGLVHGCLLVFLGLSVGIAIRLVGALMVDAIIILPALTALPFARSLGQAMVFTAISGSASSILGLLAAVVWDLPISATVAASGVITLVVVQLVSKRVIRNSASESQA